jgi:two-component system, NarL family, invasion response regulator UvrY
VPATVGDMVEVLTVDDQAFFRSAAREVIDATPGFHAAAEAASGPEALRMVAELEPDLAIVDVRMPGMDGVETARRLVAEAPGLLVMLVSIEDAANLPSSVAGCGAAALVRKQDFRPALLRELWATAAPSRGAGAPPG